MKKGIKYLVVIVALVVAFVIGNSTAKTEIDGAKMDLEHVNKKIELAEKDKAEVEKALKEEGSKLDEAQLIIANKKDAEDEVKSLEDKIKKTSNEQEKVSKDIEKKKSELSLLTGQVEKAESKPINMNAGNFEVGKDIKAGRYEVHANVNSSNYFVNDGDTANVILGTDKEMSVNDYVIELKDGDTLNHGSPVTYTLLK